MTYNKMLAERVWSLLQKTPGFEKKKMFGGIVFLVNGNMACGILNDDLIVRIGPDGYDDALDTPMPGSLTQPGRS